MAAAGGCLAYRLDNDICDHPASVLPACMCVCVPVCVTHVRLEYEQKKKQKRTNIRNEEHKTLKELRSPFSEDFPHISSTPLD